VGYGIIASSIQNPIPLQNWTEWTQILQEHLSSFSFLLQTSGNDIWKSHYDWIKKVYYDQLNFVQN